MQTFVNKNDKQIYFNQVKGTIKELNPAERFCSVTLLVGHENTRLVNFTIRKTEYDILCKDKNLGDKVIVRFYLSSNFKNGRWYTMANILDILTYDKD